MTPHTPETNVDVYVRNSISLDGRHIRDQLQDLVENGLLGEYAIRTWAPAIDAEAENEDMKLVDRFSDWASLNGVSLRPAFERRKRRSEFTRVMKEVVVTPLVCLAVYEGDSLVGVYPHTTESAVNTVEDCLAWLESYNDEPEESERIREVESVSDST